MDKYTGTAIKTRIESIDTTTINSTKVKPDCFFDIYKVISYSFRIFFNVFSVKTVIIYPILIQVCGVVILMLEGSLSEFNFGEVLKLVGSAKKTGVVKLKNPDGIEGLVYFKNGEVYFSESTWKRKPIGERLIDAKKITKEQLKEALNIQKQTGKKIRLGMILIDKGFISPQDLVSFVQDQIIETILDFFTWKDGTFVFEPDRVASNEDIGIKSSIENLILQGSDRLENWKSLQKFIPNKDMVFTTVEVHSDENKVIVLRPKELKVLRYIDGVKTVKEILKESGLGQFELYRILFGLHAAGLITKSIES